MHDVSAQTPIYRKNGAYYKDTACTQPFTDQSAAKVLWRQTHIGIGHIFKRVMAVIGVFVVLVGISQLWDYADEQGWRSHDQLTRVAASEWAPGEYKSCKTSVYPDDFYLICEDATNTTPVKSFKVQFYGDPRRIRSSGLVES